MRIKALILAALLLFVITPFIFAQEPRVSIQFGGGISDVPTPRLTRPVTDVVDLQGRKELLFEWSPHERPPSGRQYYQFKIYRGYQMYASNLFIEKQLSRGTTKITISADNFENGKIYTWAVRQRDNLNQWSDYGYQSFKVIK